MCGGGGEGESWSDIWTILGVFTIGNFIILGEGVRKNCGMILLIILRVRLKLDYAAPIWSPYCKTQIQQVEKVQRTKARWTCRRWRNTSSLKLEYAAPIWSPYCKTQIQQVEKVQRTAARWTCRRWRNTSSVDF